MVLIVKIDAVIRKPFCRWSGFLLQTYANVEDLNANMEDINAAPDDA